jgi:hypothetical protein
MTAAAPAMTGARRGPTDVRPLPPPAAPASSDFLIPDFLHVVT